jgi:hypothetical protein
VDTTPPELTVKSIETDTKQEVKPKQFVKECKDASQVTFSFKEEPTKKSGKQTVVIVAADAHNNTTEQEAELTRIEDKTAPKISGTKDIKIRTADCHVLPIVCCLLTYSEQNGDSTDMSHLIVPVCLLFIVPQNICISVTTPQER